MVFQTPSYLPSKDGPHLCPSHSWRNRDFLVNYNFIPLNNQGETGKYQSLQNIAWKNWQPESASSESLSVVPSQERKIKFQIVPLVIYLFSPRDSYYLLICLILCNWACLSSSLEHADCWFFLLVVTGNDSAFWEGNQSPLHPLWRLLLYPVGIIQYCQKYLELKLCT